MPLCSVYSACVHCPMYGVNFELTLLISVSIWTCHEVGMLCNSTQGSSLLSAIERLPGVAACGISSRYMRNIGVVKVEALHRT